MAKNKNGGHGHDDEVIVSQTTPQGTQENGVEYGHDQRDIYVGSIMRWLVGLALGTGLVILFLIGLWNHFDKTYAYQDEMPSPLYAAHQKPPEPRIEGFMAADDYGPLHAFPVGTQIPRDGTPEELQVVRQSEQKKLESYGLGAPDPKQYEDKHDADVLRRPMVITDDEVALVTKKYGPAPVAKKDEGKIDAKFAEGGPSDASGGLVDNISR